MVLDINALEKRINHGEMRSDEAKDRLRKIAASVSKIAETLLNNLDSAAQETGTRTILRIYDDYRENIKLLAETKSDLESRLLKIEGKLNAYNQAAVKKFTNEISRAAQASGRAQRKANFYDDFLNHVKSNSSDFQAQYSHFQIQAGAKVTGFKSFDVPAIDFVVLAAELSLHMHLGPIGTLYHLIELRKETKEREAKPLSPTLSLIAAFDLLVSAMTLIAIALRQIPTEIDKHGKPIEVDSSVAASTFKS